MTLTVLSDEQVKDILENLSLDELEDLRKTLASALHAFSTSLGTDGLGVFQQPHRVTTLHPETQATTLYMPSCGPSGMGCKGKLTVNSKSLKYTNIQVSGVPHFWRGSQRPLHPANQPNRRRQPLLPRRKANWPRPRQHAHCIPHCSRFIMPRPPPQPRQDHHRLWQRHAGLLARPPGPHDARQHRQARQHHQPPLL